MKFKATWILLGIAVAAGAYFFLVEQPRHQQEQQAASSERRLTSLAPDRVRRTVDIDAMTGQVYAA